ncbi:MAG: DNA primase noncatalytic subunit PriX [Candidatus Micrarchaeaceae archaeon]|jgi:hypothetical protein|nr:DNA primase noncatalytic subunit PriX [Candidatus Micrarchaeota archaeon]HII09830.1 DNA primase noncatalytic subunit PriX [Candidatus Micrarchaeota archaeon]
MDDDLLDFAYKYPFSQEARELVGRQRNEISTRYLESGGRNLENALSGRLKYSKISIGSVKLDYLMAYLYSRMLLSAVKRKDLIMEYAMAEAGRSVDAMLASEKEEMLRIAAELGLGINCAFDLKGANASDEFTIGFADYVNNTPRLPGFELVNQRLSSGVIRLNKGRMARVMEQAMLKEIMKGLPIKSTELPKQVIDFSKGLKFKSIAREEHRKGGGREGWIEKLLETPIADVRHRTVNLILAPYLVNTKGLDVEQASKRIIEYIERCKQIDPSTRINDRYIEYQCNYAKRKGLRPLSMERARELLGEHIDFDSK